jgi:DNA polymerase
MILEELNEKCMNCKRCRLWEQATQAVPGEGSESADIMFIGEGPGAVEDRTGRPFVGPAGKFLDELLKSIGLKRSLLPIWLNIDLQATGILKMMRWRHVDRG